MTKNLLFAFIASQAFIAANAQQFGSRTVLNSTQHRHSSFVFHDIDDDGDIDILVTTSTGTVSSSANQVSWYKNLGNNTFSARTIISSAYEDVTTVRLLDVDEDGKKDLVVGDREIGLSWIKNMGGGFFGTKVNLPYNSSLTTFEVGDMNNDGKEDIIAAELNGDSLHFVRNTGGGTFVYDSMFYWPGYNIYSIAFGDLDQDQMTDLIVSTGDTGVQKIVKFEHANGAFVQSNIYSAPSWPYIRVSWLYDVDNDGKMDVVTEGADCATFWFKNFGNNVYSTITPITEVACENYSMAQIADLDLDGYMDVLYTKFNQSNISYREGTGVAELATPLIPISGNTIPGIVGRTSLVDIDNDGDLDLFYSTDNEFGWFKNNASELSVNAPRASEFSVYPNPANNALNIASSAIGIEGYAIYDATGKVIEKVTLPAAEANHTVNVANLSNGLYFVEIQAGGGKEVKKFVKN